MLNKLIIVSFLILGLTACQTPTQTALAQIAVQRAVYEVIKDHPGRAERIVQIATQVEAVAGGEVAATPAILESVIRSQIKWTELAPPDVQMVDSLITLLRVELENQFAKITVDEQKLLVVKTVASWVRQTAQLYVPAK